MARIPFLAGNWKLHLAPDEAEAIARELAHRSEHLLDVTLAVFPTAVSIPAVVASLVESRVQVGIQEIEVRHEGPFTGSNSALMARKLGCHYALCGHSERRHGYGDSEERVGSRVAASLDAGLLPVLCVGETLQERRDGALEAVLGRQLEAGLAPIERDQATSVTLAYEPVWAIGTGETATPEQAQDVHAWIRGWLRNRWGATLADDVRILYGGSVKPNNAEALLSCPDIDGALVGGASLNADAFLAIVEAAS